MICIFNHTSHNICLAGLASHCVNNNDIFDGEILVYLTVYRTVIEKSLCCFLSLGSFSYLQC
jgi:hypothetical protein